MDRMNSDVTVRETNLKSLVPSTWEDGTVRVVAVDECAAAGRSLAHSFATDPLSKYLMDGNDTRKSSPEDVWKLHVSLMTTVVASHTRSGMVTTIGPDHDALAVWCCPGGDTEDLWTILRSGMVSLYFRLSREGRKRYYREMLPLLHRTKAEVMGDRDNDCYYLVYIGTRPHARCRGYAARLIRDIAEKADAQNRPMYLESSSLSNNVFYAKFGFEVREEIALKRGPELVKLFIMVREPRPLKVADLSPATTSQASSGDEEV